MNTMQLGCFVEVAAQLSFSKAAEALHVSQPTVSHQIKTLEDELGCMLFVRSTRSVRLTEDGFAFLEYAHDILDIAARAERRLAHKQRPSAKQLRIGVHDGLEAQMLASTIRRMRADVEDFDPVVRMAPFSALRSMLENGSVDVLLEYRSPTGEPDGASTFRRIMECPAVCVCAPDHPAAQFERPTVEDLAQSGRIAVGDPHHCAAAIVELQRDVMSGMGAHQVMMAYNIEIALALASAGAAFTVLAGIPAMQIAPLRFLPIEGLPAATLGVRVRRGRRATILDRFIELLTEELQTLPTAPVGNAGPA